MTAGSIQVPSIIPLRAPIAGKSKNCIDTCTPIEIKTESQNAEIYFTIDGSKPDPFAALGAERSTIKYTKPFKLREGKKVVKALAISMDGTRQSHIVTKSFEVERCDGQSSNSGGDGDKKYAKNNDEYSFIDELERERKKELQKKRSILKKIVDTSNLSHRSGGSLSDNESSRYHHHNSASGMRHSRTHDLNQSAFLKSAGNFHSLSKDDLSMNRSRIVMPDSSAQALRLQRETDFLRCIYCFSVRPHDPLARHCTECGKSLPQIPQTRLATPSSGNLGTCFFCKSIVPFNTPICVICENPINPNIQPQTNVKVIGKVICTHCTTSNPANYTTCVACDSKLLPGAAVHPVDLALTSTQHAGPATKSYTCHQCFRINRNDARFCDWCGAKPQKVPVFQVCNRCGCNNNPYCKYCTSCGSLMQPSNFQNSSSNGFNNSWMANIDSKAANILNKQYSTVSTQTYGLFYTSAKGLENKTEKDLKLSLIERDFHDRRPTSLTAVSAGKGYWRQQMDHICAHLKAYAQNNSEFRAVVGEPRLGKINSAKVDIDSSWCTITATFPIRSNNLGKDSFSSSALIDRTLNTNNNLTNADYEMMAAAIARRDSSSERSLLDDSINSENHKPVRPKSSGTRPKRSTTDPDESGLTAEDRQLAKELSKNGRGRRREVEDLINEGANPNAKTKEGVTMLHMAIRNKHFDCIPILLQKKADIEARVPPKNNSVLHEAVLIGPDADVVIKALLEFGANPNWKNSRNETAFDLAIKENNTAAINMLGAQVGNEMFKNYLKSKSNDIRP